MKIRDLYLDIESGDIAAIEVTVDFSPATPDTRDCPGDGPEISTGNIVRVTYLGAGMAYHEDVMTWDVFLLTYAASASLTLAKAEEKVYDGLLEAAEAKFADIYDGPEDGDAWSGGFADDH